MYGAAYLCTEQHIHVRTVYSCTEQYIFMYGAAYSCTEHHIHVRSSIFMYVHFEVSNVNANTLYFKMSNTMQIYLIKSK